MHDDAVQALIGRDRELQELEALADRTIAGRGGGLLLHGPAGIGKSSVLSSLAQLARGKGQRVLAASGVQSETRLAFSGLHQLLRPILDQTEGLPDRQRDALLSAFGLSEAEAPDSYLIALAVLELLALSASSRPVLLIVDDAQWLDRPSADALAFVMRRIDEDPIAIVAASRDGYPTPFDALPLPRRQMIPLDDAAAEALLDACSPGLVGSLKRTILTQALGNPLAIVELAGAPQRHGVELGRPVGELHISARLEAAFTARFRDLPADAQTILLVAAASDRDMLAEVVDAGRRLVPADTDVLDAFAPAIDADLVAVDDQRLAFRHPLVRSAIYQHATMSRRASVHIALADVLSADPDRRAWHRAAATYHPDEEVAAEVEAAAVRAERRGGRRVTLEALARSADLTPDADRRADRLLRAAELAFDLGDILTTLRLHGEIDPSRLGPRASGQYRLLSETLAPPAKDPPTRVGELLTVAVDLHAQGEADLALRFAHLAAGQTWVTDVGATLRSKVLDTADAVSSAATNPLLLSVYSQTDPGGHGPLLIERSRSLPPSSIDADVAYQVGSALNLAGAFSLSSAYLSSAATQLRTEGRLRRLVEVLCQQAWSAFTTVDWAVAVPAADEALRLARETEQPFWEASALTVQSMLVGLRDDAAQADRLVGAAEAIALPMGANPMLCGIQLTRGLNDLSAGRYDEAWAQLYRMFQPRDPSYHHFQSAWAIGDLAEAAVATDQVDLARRQLGLFESETGPAAITWPQIALLYARPMLADEDESEALFQAALGSDLSRWPLYRARILLSYGRWLRRHRRTAESRAPLRSSREAFDALGARGFAEQARSELRAAGEGSESPTSSAWRDLSPQELQIARLAASGLSNRQIGERLYLSHRTVASHLYRAYPKLGITSRSQLPGVLDAQA